MILVTGGAGLLGKALITELLLAGKPVRAIYHKTQLADFNDENLQQVQCDILDVVGLEEAMQGVQQVYHCAAIITFNPKRRQEMFKINIEGTANMVNAALDAGVQKMLYVSSVAALGRLREDKMVDETMNWTEETSNSSYGQSKYLAEMQVWRGIGEGLDAVMVNPVIILGPGDWNGGSSQIFKNVYNEFPWYADGITGFVDVRDVVKAMMQLMNSPVTAERFIISAENRSYDDVFNLIAKAFGKKPPHKKVTRGIAKMVWRLEAIKSYFTGKDPLVTRETAATAMAKVHFDNRKLTRFLPGFTYRKIEESIADTCHVLQQKLNSN
ncbi:MAG: NAD-dependent epimerase/dehydratase family protein [Chitinophagaceae bacterium]|nr:NAD-dependent epimerase/dehydratase family protein [Chitinophagaceae bacterium]MBK9532917.1 NAD-dependent epimerase/dehydratase family protein [Chitinophagaceae bacterium]